MTGGRRRPEDLELPWYPPRLPLPAPTADEAGTLQAFDDFKRAMKFRRVLQRSLRGLGITFAEWRVLEATYRLWRQTEVPVSHQQVARELDLGEGSVSRLMWQLSLRGLVSHDLDGLALAYRVIMTDASKALMSGGYSLAARAAGATLAASRTNAVAETLVSAVELVAGAGAGR